MSATWMCHYIQYNGGVQCTSTSHSKKKTTKIRKIVKATKLNDRRTHRKISIRNRECCENNYLIIRHT